MIFENIKSSLLILDNHQRKKFFTVFILILIGSIFEVISIYFFYQLIQIFLDINNYIPNKYMELIFNLLGQESGYIHKILFLLLLLYILKFLFFIFNYYKQFNFSNSLTANLSSQLMNKYMLKDYYFHIGKKTSDLVRNINTEVGQFTIGVVQQILTLATEFFILISILIMLLIIAPNIVFFALIIIVLLGFVVYKFSRKYFISYGVQRQNLAGEMLNISLQSLEGYKELKVYNVINYFLKKFNFTAKSFSNVNTMVMLIQQFPRLIFELILVFLIAVIVLFNFETLTDVSNNSDLLSKIGLLALSSFKLIPSISKIIVALQNIKFNVPSLEILKREKNSHISSKKSNSTEINFNRKIEFTNVSFAYPNSKVNTLENVTLNINKGSKIGIMGESGSGKTTLINLLIGLIDPNSGQILIDGQKHEIKENFNWLNKISYVPQKIFMSESSVKENIAFGIEDSLINLGKMDKSLEYSNLIDLISSLDEGVNYNVGRRGDKLSLGQQQRIGIARAFYKNSELLIFDEFTSSLDDKTEDLILDTIFKNELKKTMIFISHKEKTLKYCDEIYFIKNRNIKKIK